MGADLTISMGVGAITLADLLTHRTNLRDLALRISEVQPAGGVAQIDYWAQLRQLLVQAGSSTPDRRYSNYNYWALTAVIDACTDVRFDDYLTQRLLLDARFSSVRRRVVDPTLGALYYTGTAPNWARGVLLSDYGNWPGDGGLYTTANQLTDWAYALYTRQPVAQIPIAEAAGRRPLVSIAGIDRLFGTTGYFSGGIPSRPSPPAAAQTRYQHNGGTTVGGGSVNGNIAVVVGPSGSVYTALYVANGSLGADPPFEAAVAALPWT